jgi:CubicO group peptidase (beta-lactamase class C family)
MRAALIAIAWMASLAHAAPEEAILGKGEGYPVCPPAVLVEVRCLVGEVSRRDEVYPSRKVAKAATPRALQRAAEPDLRYRYQGEERDIDGYLANHRVTGLVIAKGDAILVERYQYDRTPQHRMTSHSMAKTVVAMLVGIAMAEGSIGSIDDRVDRYVPELAGNRLRRNAIRHLLSMSSGVRFSEVYSGTDDVATLVHLSLLGESEGGVATVVPFNVREREPGVKFSYSSADTQVLGLVLRAATGKPLSDYLSEKIWQPMGAEAEATWIVDKGGYETAFTGINATVRDYARLGLLLANDGARDGRAIIPAGWVRAATTPPAKQFEPGATSMSPLFGYGYQTWILAGSAREFALRGVRSQLILVNPGAKLVMVQTAAGNMGEPVGEALSLWLAVTRRFAN